MKKLVVLGKTLRSNLFHADVIFIVCSNKLMEISVIYSVKFYIIREISKLNFSEEENR